MESEIIGKVFYHRGYPLYREGKKDAAGNEKWRCKHVKSQCRFRLTTEPGTARVVKDSVNVHSCGAPQPMSRLKALNRYVATTFF